jgi:hypothetical protein
MKQFAVAFTTTGSSPKEGHRFGEIVLVGHENGVPTGQHARFQLDTNPTSDQQMTFPDVLAAMMTLVGDASLIVHDAGNWRRFLRAELKNIKRHGAGNLVNNVVEVRAWAHQRFPRQRKDVAAIARKAGVEVPANLSGLELEAELLCRIGNLMADPTTTSPVAVVDQTIKQPTGRNWIESAGNFWRNLTGRA